MRKPFAQLNYYQMLDISPGAVPFEIRHAYNAALQIYQPSALASYSFFSEEERREILALLDKAYATLINETSRKAYDDVLMSTGEIDKKEETKPEDKKPVSIFEINRGSAAVILAGNEALQDKIRQSESIGAILAQKSLSGADLKKVRDELGVSLEQITQETKVRMDHLQSIEADDAARLPAPVFLKGFVKAYLKCLCLEPVDDLSARYMETVKKR